MNIKKRHNNVITDKESHESNYDSLIEINKDNLFFLSFWNGMSIGDYRRLTEIENSKGTLKFQKKYTFKFKNKEKFEVNLLENPDVFDFELELFPEFSDSALVALELSHSRDIGDGQFSDSWEEIRRRIAITEKAEIYRTKEEKDYLRSQNERNKRQGKINEYCINQLLELYKEKYGKPKITKSESEDIIFKGESIILKWELDNKIIRIEYTNLKSGGKYFDSIQYLDKQFSSEREQNRIRIQAEQDSLILESKSHI